MTLDHDLRAQKWWFPLLIAALGACNGSTTTTSAAATSDAGNTANGDAGSASIKLMALPIGDGKYAAAPQRGYVYSCQRTFGGIGGASVDGPWIDTDAGTFDFLAKVVVQGSVSWPTHSFSSSVSGSTRTITGDALPDHDTGTFPIASSDPAYAYDQNPNSIKSQTLSWALPQLPTVATTEGCLSGGPIGVLLN
jgi:hypothetical protein